MKRFFGMMPASEIKKAANFKTEDGHTIRIDAGPHGWTITWADMSSTYRDVDQSTEANFNEALESAKEKFKLIPIHEQPLKRVCLSR